MNIEEIKMEEYSGCGINCNNNSNNKFPSRLYNEISKEFSPFDAILFQGGDVVSKTIMIAEEMSVDDDGEYKFSHLGMLVNSQVLPDIKQLIPGEWYVFESTMSMQPYDSVPDVVSKQGKFGTQIRHLTEIVHSYNGKMAWGKLINNPWNENFTCTFSTIDNSDYRIEIKEENDKTVETNKRKLENKENNKKENKCDVKKLYNPHPFKITDLLFQSLNLQERRDLLAQEMSAIYQNFAHSMYNPNCLDCFAAAFKCLRPMRDRIDTLVICKHMLLTNMGIKPLKSKNGTIYTVNGWVFCSELIAICWKNIGVLNSTIDCRDWLPIDCFGVRQNYPKIVQDPIFLLHGANNSKSDNVHILSTDVAGQFLK